MIIPVIMAGGSGQRFWPKSRLSLPKQFLKLTDEFTMIQATVNRTSKLAQPSDVMIVTNVDYAAVAAEQLPQVPVENIIVEPMKRNTAACIGLAALHIERKNPDAVMVILPSDHLIKNETALSEILTEGAELAAEQDCIVTIGVKPNRPETGYGYIHFEELAFWGRHQIFKVKKFVEKPDKATAQQYLKSGKYLWNSGMFMVKASVIRRYIKELMPKLHEGLEKIKAAMGTPNEDRVLEQEYSKLESVSIDYGIMEKINSIYTIPGDFGWDDVGSWSALESINKGDENGNVMKGNILGEDIKNCIVQGSTKLIALLGLENTVVVDTDDVILVCSKDKTQDIGKLLNLIKERNMISYL